MIAAVIIQALTFTVTEDRTEDTIQMIFPLSKVENKKQDKRIYLI